MRADVQTGYTWAWKLYTGKEGDREVGSQSGHGVSGRRAASGEGLRYRH